MTSEIVERHHESFVAHHEKRLLRAIAAKLPLWVTPDRLTAFGVFGSIVVFAGYVAGHLSAQWLWLANLGLVLNWLGDSLDGTVARVRQIERPRYGYFLDQNVDVISNLLMALGVGFSPWARLDSALLMLTSYHMLSIHTFVRTVVTQKFHVDIKGLGPTEMRLGIMFMNFGILIFGTQPISLLSLSVTWCDILIVIAAFGLAVLFVVEVSQESLKLRKEETPRNT